MQGIVLIVCSKTKTSVSEQGGYPNTCVSLVLARIPNNTRIAYNTDIQSLIHVEVFTFCLKFGLAPKANEVMFMIYCFEKAYSPSSITSHISGLSFFP